MGTNQRLAVNWTDLADTPSSFAGQADNFTQVNPGETGLEFHDLFGSANTWTATQTVDDIVPAVDQTDNIGLDATRFLSAHARLGVFVGSSNATGAGSPNNAAGTRSFGTYPTGIMAGNQAEGGLGGTAIHYLRGGAFKGVACIGNAAAGGTGDALLSNRSGGSSLFGSAYTYGTGDVTVEATAFGNFTTAYAYTNGTLLHRFSNRGGGAFLAGYSVGSGAVDVSVTGPGAFCNVRPQTSGSGSVSNALASGAGSMVVGSIVSSGSATSSMTALGNGAMVAGRAENQLGAGGVMTASGPGSAALGIADGATISATSSGARAHGFARSGNAITASGLGAFAHGDSASGAIIANQTNSVQFGPGTNAQTDSLKVGAAGIRIKGTTGAPGTPVDGDHWIDTSRLVVRSDGVDWTFEQSAAFTRNATVVEDRTLLASASATVTNNNNVLAALIADFQAFGKLG